MSTRVNKAEKNQKAAITAPLKKSGGNATFQLVDQRPETIVQRKLQKVANARSQAPVPRPQENGNPAEIDQAKPQLSPSTSNPNAVIQRLIVNGGASSLMDEARKPSGWITLSTLDVGIKMDTGKTIVEREKIGSGLKIGKDENIFIVGHGAKGKMAATIPAELAKQIRPVIPEGWTGFIAGLTCHAGLPEEGIDKKSGGQQLHEELGAPVIAAKGSTFTHTGIDMAVRVLKDTSYSDDFRHHYFDQLKFSTGAKRMLLMKTWPSVELFKEAEDEAIDKLFLKYGKSVDTGNPEIAKIFSGLDYSKMPKRAQESRAIDEQHIGLNHSWAEYMGGSPGSLPEIAAHATALSAKFYRSVVEYGDRYGLLHDVDTDFEYYER